MDASVPGQRRDVPVNDAAAFPRLLWILLPGLVVTLFHIITNGQYGFHRDELDVLIYARQLEWGYVSYPPVTPFLARISLELFGESLRWLRFFPAVAQGVVVILAGLMVRDMGGSRIARLLAQAAVAISPAGLMSGTLLSYAVYDYLWWVLVAFFVTRLIVTDNPRWWLGIGAAIGVGMMTKYAMAFLVVGLAVAVVLTRLRAYLKSPWLWAGAGVAILIFLPNLVWQVQHDFISLDFLSFIHARDVAEGQADAFLIDQVYLANNPFILPLWVMGLYYCLFHPQGKRFRPLAFMYLTIFIVFLVTRGRGYYLASSYVMLIAAGATWWQGWLSGRQKTGRLIGQAASIVLLIAGTVMGVLVAKPTIPIGTDLWEKISGINEVFVDMVGWDDMAATLADVYEGLPEEEKADAVIIAGNYGEAGAIDLYGDAYGLPRMISGSNSLWYRGFGDAEPGTVIVVGYVGAVVLPAFESCEEAARSTNRYGVVNEETTDYPFIYVCRRPVNSWAEMWPEMLMFQ